MSVGKNINKFCRKKKQFLLTKNKSPHIVIEEPTNSVAEGQQNLEDVHVYLLIL